MALSVMAQQPLELVRVNRPHYFKSLIPPGNYSGLTFLGGNHYAMVSDKGESDGFFVLEIDVDSLNGDIRQVSNFQFVAAEGPNRDNEGICYMHDYHTLFISGEADHRVVEYRLDGQRTGLELQLPGRFTQAWPNYSLEALTYSSATHRFWTISEGTLRGDGTLSIPANGVPNRLRLQCCSADMRPFRQYAYLMDAPTVSRSASHYAIGVCALAALDDGRLLVLERELFVPKKVLGSFVRNKLFLIAPEERYALDDKPFTERTPFLPKVLVYEWQTRLNLLHQDFSNYEGMCLGPRLADGSQVVLLCADSQNQYGGILRDWLMTLVVH